MFRPYLPAPAKGFIEGDEVCGCSGLALREFGFDGELRPLRVQDRQKIR